MHDYSYSKGKVHPKIGHDVPEGCRGASVLLFFNLGARWGWVVNATPRPLYHRKRDLVPIVRVGWEGGGATGRCGEKKNLTFTGIRTLNRQARVESLYQLRYPGSVHSYG